MAFRSTGYFKQLANRLRGSTATYATSTPPKMKSYAPAMDSGYGQDAKTPKKVQGDFVAVYVAVGMIALSTTLGIYTMMHQLKNSPQVHVNKKRRETLPEVEEPERVLGETDKYYKQSFFRKVAHVQDNNTKGYNIPDTIRGDVFTLTSRAETLQSVGVDPKFRAQDH